MFSVFCFFPSKMYKLKWPSFLISIQNYFSVLLWKHDVQLSLGHFPYFLPNCGLYSCGFSVEISTAVNLMSVLCVWRLWQKRHTVQAIKRLATSAAVTAFWALPNTQQCGHHTNTRQKVSLCCTGVSVSLESTRQMNRAGLKRCAHYFEWRKSVLWGGLIWCEKGFIAI